MQREGLQKTVVFGLSKPAQGKKKAVRGKVRSIESAGNRRGGESAGGLIRGELRVGLGSDRFSHSKSPCGQRLQK